MVTHRITLLEADSVSLNCLQRELEGSGFEVTAADKPATALRLAGERGSEALLLDPVFLEPAELAAVRTLPDHPVFAGSPVLVLPGCPEAVVAKLGFGERARYLAASADPIPAVLEGLALELGLAKVGVSGVQPERRALMLQSAAAGVARLRAAFPQVTAAASDPVVLAGLVAHAHAVVMRAALAGEPVLAALARAFQGLLVALPSIPQAAVPNAVKTLTGALDAIGALCDPVALAGLRPPEESTVIIVDDEPFARDAALAALKRSGLRVATAATADEALQRVNEHAFDLFLLDINLAEASGFDLGAKLREAPRHKTTPILFLTGMGTFQNRVQSTLSGGNDFLTKPFHPHDLVLRVLTWLYRGRRA
jgi:DNA-binding response OmpR family regulator